MRSSLTPSSIELEGLLPLDVLDTSGPTNSNDGEVDTFAHPLDKDEEVDEPLLSQMHGRRKAFEMELIRNQSEPASCMGDTWRLLASSMLAVFLCGPFIVSRVRHHSSSLSPSSLWPDPIHTNVCAKELKINFAQLYYDLAANKTSLCSDDMAVRRKWFLAKPKVTANTRVLLLLLRHRRFVNATIQCTQNPSRNVTLKNGRKL